ncbi:MULTISPECIES: GAF domain-containing sensor histidine kinase [unclassified Janthinobacterium]|uniref:GAF domain-containing sensor histidine kinase n=1 Tax=unclassified Janthinobacterium TaxID=2610881 RepID=UPI000348860E|nr:MULTISPECIES: ATP-binding protein [unclassified Janthinobacterium]MEC5162787.1 two-component system nitrate/nitrite sensor histidine kinase NarX [Janthinobacterium sp. CG_S6]
MNPHRSIAPVKRSSLRSANRVRARADAGATPGATPGALARRVREQAAQLDAQASQMAALQDVTALLAAQQTIEQLCRGFLLRVMRFSGADGGTVRTLDRQRGNVHIVVHEGIPEQLIEQEHCIRAQDCLCGEAIVQGVIVVKDLRRLGREAGRLYRCADEGFVSLAVFQVRVREEAIGSFSLHFGRRRGLGAATLRLLETLGRSLGIAVDNQRLIALEKQVAVAQERGLMAQGLHDSIAQGLNLISLHAQLLEDSVRRGNLAEVAEVVPLLRAGVDESYCDVRELLHNFRTRWPGGDVDAKVREVLAKFERQSGLPCALELRGSGAPLAPEQQLQVLFILQEALSNIRKHAGAGAVWVDVDNDRDFALTVRDDGRGFAPAQLGESEQHVGLSIMRERALRLGAQLDIVSEPGAGATVSLSLPRENRQVA